MNSSTSSSDAAVPSGRREWRVLVALLAILAVAEVGLRIVGTSLSGDVAHLEAVPAIVEGTVAAEGETVLLWGNSLLGEGVDRDALEQRLEEITSRDFAVGKVNPDGSTPIEWSYLLRATFGGGADGRVPGALVLAFGPGHLGDRSPHETLERLAIHHVGSEDVGLFLRTEVHTLEDRAAFLAARAFRLVGLGERIQPRVLDLIIPGYRQRALALLARDWVREATVTDDGDLGVDPEGLGVSLAEGPHRGGAQPEGGPPMGLGHHRHFRRLVDDLSRAGVPLILLPMPEARGWELSTSERDVISKCGLTVMDIRQAAALPPERFPDGSHMDAEGRARFTYTLAPRLAALLDGPREELIPSPCPPPSAP